MAHEEAGAQRRPIGPLVWALEEHGGILTATSWTSPTGPITVQVRLPDDDYRDKKCREILDEWRNA